MRGRAGVPRCSTGSCVAVDGAKAMADALAGVIAEKGPLAK